MITEHIWHIVGAVAITLVVVGFVSALSAILTTRTPQGAIAWSLALIGFPYFAVPLYWVFGRRRFHGYRERLRASRQKHAKEIFAAYDAIAHFRPELPPDRRDSFAMLEKLVQFPFTRGNSVELLIDGRATFDAIFASLDAAKDYIFVEFYIVNDDELGREFARRLVAKAKTGVEVRMLYDNVGSFSLPAHYAAELCAAGVDARAFRTSRGPKNRFQINFRNHRKIVVVDGNVAFVGGFNVGDEYLGRHGPWRDTHARIEGPSVQCIQAAFIADWSWVADAIPNANWTPKASPHGDMSVLALPTSPSDHEESCAIFFHQAIVAAKKRIWIATPYFVPDSPVFEALKIAALRGVDVRLLLPIRADSLFVHLASLSFIPDAQRCGVQVLRYRKGFMHQKVILVDDDVASVGTANMDNRSMRLNFEITMLVVDRAFAKKVEAMLECDLEGATPAPPNSQRKRDIPFRIAVRAARLLEPIL